MTMTTREGEGVGSHHHHHWTPNRRREQLPFAGWKRGAGRPGTTGRSSGHNDDRNGETATTTARRRRRRRRRQRRRRTQHNGTILSPAFGVGAGFFLLFVLINIFLALPSDVFAWG
jgi:hypothetical protein